MAGGAAYGVGTYFAGAGLAAGGAAMAGGATLGAGAAAGMAAIPVVGWIALAAMAVDMLTGGGLFGTAGKVQGGEAGLNVTSSGATATEGLSIKGKKPLFGGSWWDWKTVDPSQQAKDAATAFYD
ncbi:hypothetical protein [Dokdonella soli]|uniref:Uncharacterized protein n=1 Tax=Dokdonella soli TaxID=529810 RepID=A0ABP3TTX7_9GAMM